MAHLATNAQDAAGRWFGRELVQEHINQRTAENQRRRRRVVV